MMAHGAAPAAGEQPAQVPRGAPLGWRLAAQIPGSRFWGWAGPLLITAFGTWLRFSRLSLPNAVVYDETDYVGDAWSILRHGVELNHVADANTLLVSGKSDILAGGGEFVAHPPLGKVVIAGGEWLFGLTPFGWRFAVAVLGSLAILMTARIARRMTRSTLLGCVAGLLLALDSLEFVMSRTALLDISLMFWVLAAFGCLVIDRDVTRGRIAAAAAAAEAAAEPAEIGAETQVGAETQAGGETEAGGEVADGVVRPENGPRAGVRWWRLLAGLCLGLACASKWSGVWYLPVFGALTLAWDLGARKASGSGRPGGWPGTWRGKGGTAIREGGGLLAAFAVIPAVAYLASWSGWFASSAGHDRNWAAEHGNHTPIWSALDSLYQYHRAMLQFGVTLSKHHPYQSVPWNWLVMSRPTSFFYNSASHACGVKNCSQEVLAIGTPAIWWASIGALVFCVLWWLGRRDWRAGAVLAAVAAGWLPWFWYAWHDHRTMFYYYAVVFVPYLVIAITLCLGLIIGRAGAGAARRTAGAAAVGVYLIAVLANFYYLYPLLAAKIIPYTSWLSRMWYHGWI